MAQKINVSKRFTARLTNGTIIEYEPLQSPTKRDCEAIWKFLISDEERLKQNGYNDLIIGAHNFDNLLSMALGNQAFKCLVVLIEFYNERLRD